MEVSIIKIGNSKGFRLSKTILERYNITDKMELILEKEQIILRPIPEPRKDWDNAYCFTEKRLDNYKKRCSKKEKNFKAFYSWILLKIYI